MVHHSFGVIFVDVIINATVNIAVPTNLMHESYEWGLKADLKPSGQLNLFGKAGGRKMTVL